MSSKHAIKHSLIPLYPVSLDRCQGFSLNSEINRKYLFTNRSFINRPYCKQLHYFLHNQVFLNRRSMRAKTQVQQLFASAQTQQRGRKRPTGEKRKRKREGLPEAPWAGAWRRPRRRSRRWRTVQRSGEAEGAAWEGGRSEGSPECSYGTARRPGMRESYRTKTE